MSYYLDSLSEQEKKICWRTTSVTLEEEEEEEEEDLDEKKRKKLVRLCASGTHSSGTFLLDRKQTKLVAKSNNVNPVKLDQYTKKTRRFRFSGFFCLFVFYFRLVT